MVSTAGTTHPKVSGSGGSVAAPANCGLCRTLHTRIRVLETVKYVAVVGDYGYNGLQGHWYSYGLCGGVTAATTTELKLDNHVKMRLGCCDPQ